MTTGAAAGPRRGSAPVRRLRLATGIVLFTYVTTHLINHALGLVSLGAMEAMLAVQTFVWQGVGGTLLLYASLMTHALLGLWALYERRYFRWTKREAVQLVLGLSIPPLLANHLCVTRLSLSVFGLQKGYAQELYALWVAPGVWGAVQVAVLLAAWVHGAIGLHASMRLRHWFTRAAPYLLVGAVLLPVLALLGFEQGGRTLALLALDPSWQATALSVTRVGTADQKAAAAQWRIAFIAGYGVLVVAVLLARALRGWAEARRGMIRIAYPNGTSVRVARGLTVLDASRIGRVPHPSVCGGRGRCSTCRVRVLGPPEAIPPPSLSEQAVLDRIHAQSATVRLACQLRPRGDIAVLPLVGTAQAHRQIAQWRHTPPAEERFVVALFADMRGSTEFARRHLPFDNLFLLSSFVGALADAVGRAGGVANQFMGDGILALFGLETDTAAPRQTLCRQALLACRHITAAVDDFNNAFARELLRPIGCGIGVHAGTAIVGEIGFGRHVTSTALGDPVNVASRLQEMTRQMDCSALISEDVLRAAGEPAGLPVGIDVRGHGRMLARAFAAGDLRRPRPATGATRPA